MNHLDYKAVVFDMDGIIFDSERCVMECWIDLADKYNIPNILEPYMKCIGTNKKRTKEIMQSYYGENFDFDAYDKEKADTYHQKYDGGRLPLKPGVFALLDYLKENGKLIALASSTRRQTVISQLEDANIIQYFHSIICGDMVSNSKPHPEIFLKACESMDVDPAYVYAIEDSYNGIRAAHTGGLMPIMVPDLLPATEEMENLSVTICDSLNSVIEYIEKREI